MENTTNPNICWTHTEMSARAVSVISKALMHLDYYKQKQVAGEPTLAVLANVLQGFNLRGIRGCGQHTFKEIDKVFKDRGLTVVYGKHILPKKQYKQHKHGKQ